MFWLIRQTHNVPSGARTANALRSLVSGTRRAGLRHSALTQQYHLDALALRRGNLPPQRSPQPPHLGFAAFDHLFPRIRWRSESHLGQQKQPAVPAAYLKNPRFKPLWRWYKMQVTQAIGPPRLLR